MSKTMDDGLLRKFNEVETIHWWWSGRRELLKLLLKNKRPTKILDVGCGTGETLSFIKTLSTMISSILIFSLFFSVGLLLAKNG